MSFFFWVLKFEICLGIWWLFKCFKDELLLRLDKSATERARVYVVHRLQLHIVLWAQQLQVIVNVHMPTATAEEWKLFLLLLIALWLFRLFVRSSCRLVGLFAPFLIFTLTIALRVGELDGDTTRQNRGDIVQIRLVLLTNIVTELFDFAELDA